MTLSSAAPMPVDRAIAINGRLTEAHLIRAGIRSGPVPSLRGVRLSEALCAVEMLRRHPMEGPDARLPYLMSIEALFAWAVVQGQMT